MSDTGIVIAGTGSDDSSVGDKAWVNPENITTDDTADAGIDAFFDSPFMSHYLRASSFGFSVPEGATINGIEVFITRRESSGTGNLEDNTVKLVNGSAAIVGDNKAVVGNWSRIETEQTYGGAADDWNASLTDTDVNDTDFGVVINVNILNGVLTRGAVNYIKIRVTYTEGASSTIQGVQSITGVQTIQW